MEYLYPFFIYIKDTIMTDIKKAVKLFAKSSLGKTKNKLGEQIKEILK